jgi:IclR family mhp operon transcriptional activator
MNENASADYKTVRGLSRGLLLLNLLNKFDGGATVGTLAEFSGLHRTTVRRLLETLQDEGYVRRSRSDDSFRLTIKVRQLSEGFRDEHWISALATPLLGELLREVYGRPTSPPWTSMRWWCAKPPTASAASRSTGRWSAAACRCC